MDNETFEYDKSFAVLSDVNKLKEDREPSETENLIHESGRIQLNTYQSFVQNMMNPRSDLRSLLLFHMTGTGKTITALATATEYVRQYQMSAETNSISSVIVLGFTKDIFKQELMTHPEFNFVNMDEAKSLKELELHMHESQSVYDQYINKRKLFQRRLVKREVKGIYQFFGYRQFANRIMNMSDVQAMIETHRNGENIDALDIDSQTITEWIETGKVRINTAFIRSLSKSLMICDEVHNLYKSEGLNTYGVAIQCVFDYFFKTLPPNDADYGCIRSLLLSATPLTSSALEIIPIAVLLTGERLEYNKLFKLTDGVDQLTVQGLAKIRQVIAGRISYIMDDNPKEYPSSAFVGDTIAGIEYLKFIRTTPISHQLKCFEHWNQRTESGAEERGINMIKDIVLPATNDSPHGTIFSKYIAELATLPDNIAVRRSASGIFSSNIFKLKQLQKYSSKYAELVRLCIKMKSIDHGKIFIYHPFVQGSGTEIITSILVANGFLLDGDVPVKESICMTCDLTYNDHQKRTTDHDFVPICMTVVNGALSKTAIASRLNAFNNDQNVFGEKIKIIIGSKAMRESHTLKTCRHIIITHEPSSISEMIQIIGRAVRKKVHDLLPAGKRSVSIRILTTNISSIKHAAGDNASNEELAYKTKILQYRQIDRIERVMYDVSIDYLINFRFKQRETPPLIGEAFPLDVVSYNKYQKTLTQGYNDMRNGNTPQGIHTTRFNVFYFENEVRLVIMIIKRILLDYQPVISIHDLKELVRAPPFHIEYNTKLISDEALAVATQKISFTEDQLRMKTTANKLSVVDSLFDQSSIIIDTHNRECMVVCIGSQLCSDSYLAIKSVASIAEGDHSTIDSFRQVSLTRFDNPIDLKELSERWSSTIDIKDIVDDIKRNKHSLEITITKLPIKSNTVLVEWAIQIACDFAIKKIKNTNLEVAIKVISYFQSTRLLIFVSDLKQTRIYDLYKKYDIDTGASWFSKTTKPSTASLPIGHSIGDSIKIYKQSDASWLSLRSIGVGLQTKHPYGFYIYEEQIGDSLNVAIKIKFDKDVKAKGITMTFLQRSELADIAKQLNLSISLSLQKVVAVNMIVAAAWKIQAKMYPKRVIYRIIDLN